MAGPNIAPLYNLTAQQARFVRRVVAGCTPAQAAESAMYSCSETSSFASIGDYLTSVPQIILAIRAELARAMRTEGASTSYAFLLDTVRDTAAPRGARVDAAKTILDRAGYIAPKAEAAAPGEKMLGEMTQAELLQVINECEGELAGRATPVNALSGLELESQDDDMFS